MSNLSEKEKAVVSAVVCQECSGLEIIDRVKIVSSGKVKISLGHLYSILHNLVEKGYLEARWGNDRPKERGYQRRRYYKATEMGKDFSNE